MSRFAYKEFESLKKKYPEWTTWTCFAETVKGKEYSKVILRDRFLELVNKEDYEGVPLDEILDFLSKLKKEALLYKGPKYSVPFIEGVWFKLRNTSSITN
jgi:hypothetical protein